MRMSWGTGITMVYITFALSTLGMVAFVSTQAVDLVRSDYYEDSLLRDQHAMEEQNAKGVADSVTVSLVHGKLTISMPSRFRNSIGMVKLYRASSPAADTAVPLRLDAMGTMQVDMQNRLPGKWNVALHWKADKVYSLARTVYN